jgi:hypothetical protein
LTAKAPKNGTICVHSFQPFDIVMMNGIEVYRNFNFDFVVGDQVIFEYDHLWARKDLIDAALSGKLLLHLMI